MKRTNGDQGAVFLEFAIILPLIISFLFVLIELARYAAVSTVIAYSAASGLQLAQSMDALEFDPYVSSIERYESMREARKLVADEATRVVRQTLSWAFGAGGNVPFSRFRHVTSQEDLKAYREPLDALVLLPGESAIQIDPNTKEDRGLVNSDAHWRDHPDYCAKQSDTCGAPRGDPEKSRKFFISNLTATYPIIVEVRAEFRFLFPWLQPISIAGIAAGYREVYPQLPEKYPNEVLQK